MAESLSLPPMFPVPAVASSSSKRPDTLFPTDARGCVVLPPPPPLDPSRPRRLHPTDYSISFDSHWLNPRHQRRVTTSRAVQRHRVSESSSYNDDSEGASSNARKDSPCTGLSTLSPHLHSVHALQRRVSPESYLQLERRSPSDPSFGPNPERLLRERPSSSSSYTLSESLNPSTGEEAGEGSTSPIACPYPYPPQSVSVHCQGPLKSVVKKRKRITTYANQVLNEHFNRSRFPDLAERQALANRLELPERKIQIWFQNRRRKVKDEE